MHERSLLPMSLRRRENSKSTTRLPPKTTSTVRKPSGKITKIIRKPMSEKESKQREALKEQLLSCTEKLLVVLASGGVPKDPYLDELQQQLAVFKEEDASEGGGRLNLDDIVASLTQADAAVERSWSFASCYPSMDVMSLISTLLEVRSLLCEVASLTSKPVQRKSHTLRADPKADTNSLAVAEEAVHKITEVITKCNVGLYKIRALNQVASGHTANMN